MRSDWLFAAISKLSPLFHSRTKLTKCQGRPLYPIRWCLSRASARTIFTLELDISPWLVWISRHIRHLLTFPWKFRNFGPVCICIRFLPDGELIVQIEMNEKVEKINNTILYSDNKVLLFPCFKEGFPLEIHKYWRVSEVWEKVERWRSGARDRRWLR